jgi:hypothetical protein
MSHCLGTRAYCLQPRALARLIWLAPNVVDRLGALRGQGESYNDVIQRLAKA